MPGEFYIEGRQEKVDITEIRNLISQIQTGVTSVQNSVTELVNKSEGLAPVTGSVAADWGDDEFELVTIGSHGARYKVHSLLVSIHNLEGNVVTIRVYTAVKGEERKVYDQSFDAVSDPPGLWIINGTVGIHEALIVTLQSDSEDDNGKEVDYDYMLEVM